MSKEKEITGLLRSLGEIEEITVAKTKQVWYNREMTFDTGQSYRYYNTNKDKLIALEALIDGEVKYSIGEKGNVILHEEPAAPKKSTPKPRIVEGMGREQYWEWKAEHDKLVSAILERQFFINLAKEFAIPLGRLTDANWKELLKETVKEGIMLQNEYGKLEIQ